MCNISHQNANFKTGPDDSTVNEGQSAKVDTPILADINFAFKNLKNTNDVKFVNRVLKSGDLDSKVYTGSTYKKAFVKLSSNQKTLLVTPFVSKTLNVNDKYVRENVIAYFVSKQDKTGDMQPVIVQITADDYSSITMITLNSKNKPVDGFNLQGGPQPGPEAVGDSLTSIELKSYSLINKNIITTYRINELDYNDTTKKNVLIDSNVFVTVIDKPGNFHTRQTVKARYSRPK